MFLDRNGFKEKYPLAVKYCKEGLPPKQAIELAFDVIIDSRKYNEWFRYAMDDMEAGFDASESNLIKLFLALSKADNGLHKRLAKRAIDVAEDGNPVMLQFMLKTRYGYTEKTQTDIDITTDDAPIAFNIVPMTPNEEEEE